MKKICGTAALAAKETGFLACRDHWEEKKKRHPCLCGTPQAIWYCMRGVNDYWSK